MRGAVMAACLAAALAGGSVRATPYEKNGPTVSVSYVALKAQGAPKWAFFDPLLPGTFSHDQTLPFSWSFFPATSGTVRLRTSSSIATGRLTWWIGVTPDANAANVPGKVVITGFPQLGLRVQRVWGGEAQPAATHVRSELSGQTNRYTLIFTFDTALPKGKTTWVTVTTPSTAVEPGAVVTFADNIGPQSPWPQLSYVRPKPAKPGVLKPPLPIIRN